MFDLTPGDAEIIKQLAPTAIEFIKKLFGPGLTETGLLVGDWIRDRRTRRSLMEAAIAQHMVKALGLEPKTIPDSILIPLLQEGSLTDDKYLQERWASFLANAAMADGAEITRGFINILADLQTNEVKLLDALFTKENEISPVAYSFHFVTIGAVAHDQGLTDTLGLPTHSEDAEMHANMRDARAIKIMLRNLMRHQLVAEDIQSSIAELSRKMDSSFGPSLYGSPNVEVKHIITDLGRQFVAACRGPKANPAAE